MNAFLYRPALLPYYPANRTKPRICASSAPPQKKASATVEAVVERLREELPTLFDPNAKKDYSLYDPTVTFEDPLNKFNGISRYAANIAFLNSSPVFKSASLTVHDIAIIGEEQDTVRTRWTLSMAANLPWRPVVAFTGQSDYVVDEGSGKVVRHIDYWDSLEDSRFFSFPAVADLLGQCSPGRISLLDLGGFQLLRRTKTMELRRFSGEGDRGVLLKPGAMRNELREWIVGSRDDKETPNCFRTHDVAVKILRAPLKSLSSFQAAENQLRQEVSRTDGVEATDNSFYVLSRLDSRSVYEVWLQLSDVNVKVEP